MFLQSLQLENVRSLANVECSQGHYRGAGALYRQALAIRRELDDTVCVNFRDAPAKTMSANNDNRPLLFIEILPCEC